MRITPIYPRDRKIKDYRKPHGGAKAIDHTCKNNGDCSFCRANRLYQLTKEKLRIKQSMFDLQ